MRAWWCSTGFNSPPCGGRHCLGHDIDIPAFIEEYILHHDINPHNILIRLNSAKNLFVLSNTKCAWHILLSKEGTAPTNRSCWREHESWCVSIGCEFSVWRSKLLHIVHTSSNFVEVRYWCFHRKIQVAADFYCFLFQPATANIYKLSLCVLSICLYALRSKHSVR